jgi:hypothetical protein
MVLELGDDKGRVFRIDASPRVTKPEAPDHGGVAMKPRAHQWVGVFDNCQNMERMTRHGSDSDCRCDDLVFDSIGDNNTETKI